jgi:hypothetical protein
VSNTSQNPVQFDLQSAAFSKKREEKNKGRNISDFPQDRETVVPILC